MERKCSLLLDRRVVWLATGQPNPYSHDWDAIDANRYDVDYLGEDENGSHWKESGGRGWGKTEQEAIEDLFDQLEAV